VRYTNKMVKNILEIDMDFARKDRLFTSQHGIEDVAERRNGATEVKQFLLNRKNIFNNFRAPFTEYRVLQIVHAVAHNVEQRQIVVNDAVNQQVSQQARPLLRAVGPLVPEPGRCGDGANGLTMDRYQIVLAEKDIEFAQFETIVWPGEFSFVENNEVIAFILLDFRALVRVLTVFDRKMMETELYSQFLE